MGRSTSINLVLAILIFSCILSFAAKLPEVEGAVLFADNFANLSNWTPFSGVWTTGGGVLEGNSAEIGLIWAGNAGWTNYNVTSYLRVVNSSEVTRVGEACLAVRYKDSANFYWLGIGSWGSKYSIAKIVGGVPSELIGTGLNSEIIVGRWYLVSAVVVDNKLQLFVDGVKVLEVQDSSLSSGAVGLRSWAGTIQAKQLTVESPALSVSVTPGGPLTMTASQTQLFTASVSGGTGTKSYQWYLDGGVVSGQTTSTYTYTAATSGSPHNVYVRVTDSASTPVSANSNTISITVSGALSVSVTPGGPLTMTASQTQLFTASVSGGTGTKSYQWYLDGGVVSGQTTSTYTYTAATSGSPHNVYVRVTDSASTPVSANSNTISITVSGALSVSVTPGGPLTMTASQTQLFTASVSGGTGTKSYQWYLDGGVVSGQTTSTYTYTAATSGSPHNVYVRVTDSASTPVSANSNTISITVSGALSVSVTPGGPLTMTASQTQLFTASVSGGTGTKSYQWYLDGGVVSGQTTSTYTYTAATSGSPHNVYVRVTDSASTPVSANSNTISITVSGALSVSVTPGGPLTMTASQTQLFTASVSGGTGTKSYQWYLDGGVVSGQTTSTYTYTYPTALGSHTIDVRVMDSASTPSTALSNKVSILPIKILSVVISPIGPVTIDLGKPQVFTASATGGSGTYTNYQWYVDGSSLYDETTSTLNYSPSSVGSHYITVTVNDNSGTTSDKSAVVNVVVNKVILRLVAPTITISKTPLGQKEHIYLFSSSMTTGTSPYTYQWLKMAPGENTYTSISGATKANLDFPTSGSTVIGIWNFQLRVTDSTSTTVVSSPTSVKITNDPTPVYLKGDSHTENSVFLSWGQNDDIYFKRYDIYMSKSPSNFEWKLSIASQNNCSYQVTNLDPDTTYYFKVTTTDTFASYADSNIIEVRTDWSPFWYLLIPGVASLIVGAGSPKTVGNYKRKKEKKFKAKAEEFFNKKQHLEATECYGRACLLNIQLKDSHALVSSNLERYVTNSRSVIIQTVLGSKKLPIPDRLTNIQSELIKCASIKKYKGSLNVDDAKKIEELDVLISQAKQGNIEFIVDEALKEGELRDTLIAQMKDIAQTSLENLAQKLDLSTAATYSLLSKSIQQKLIAGYITKDKKTYLSNRYVRETLTSLF